MGRWRGKKKLEISIIGASYFACLDSKKKNNFTHHTDYLPGGKNA